MKLGIMGGTFDPPHIGHLIIAETARQQLNLDKVLFMPAGDPWRKSQRGVTPARHRLAMTRLAIEDNVCFELDGREVRREGPTYTADTLKELRAELPDAELFFITGEDVLADLPDWHEPGVVVELVRFAVAPRLGSRPPAALVPPDRIVRLEMPYIGISSTRLRHMAEEGLGLRYLVPDAVERYIRENGLYADSAA
jgi:nicotinate-nucleotide adenylyltransferase